MTIPRFSPILLVTTVIGIEAIGAIISWVFRVQPPFWPLSHGVGVEFVTAILFAVSAIGLYFIHRAMRDQDEIAQVVLPGVALIIFTITVSMLVGRLLNVPLGIEQAFIHKPDLVDLSTDIATAGQSSLFIVINFLLFGFASAVSLFPGPLSRKWLIYFGYSILTIGLIAAGGHLFHLPELYYDFGSAIVPMSLDAAFTFALLGFGLIMIGRGRTAHNET